MGHAAHPASTETKKKGKSRKFLFLFIFLLLAGGLWFGYRAYSTECPDTDADGLDDCSEQNTYHTDWYNADSDGDGFLDGEEVTKGYSPLQGGGLRLAAVDTDRDGLSDALELRFKSNLNGADSDGDGFTDGTEVQNAYSPVNKEGKKLAKRIEVSTKDQRLKYFLNDIELGDFVVSTGRNDLTPKGSFSILSKHPRAWSRTSKLWMPYWMAFSGNKFGIHELPEWPDGRKEGKGSLGKPASGGCIRLGEDSAKYLYGWAEVGTRVKIY